jgi:predicted nuclease with TOPRIM domain
MDQEKINDRLAALRKEFETGQARLRQLEGEQSYLRETLLRISGAIQVLQELVGESHPTLEKHETFPAAAATVRAPDQMNGPSPGDSSRK